MARLPVAIESPALDRRPTPHFSLRFPTFVAMGRCNRAIAVLDTPAMAENADSAMRAYAATLPVPEFESPAFTRLSRPLSEARVAVVTSAALHRPDQDRFTQADTGFRALDRADRDLVMGHWSPNFDRTGFTLDLNVVYPIDRLEELAEQGVIGSVADRHVSFAGNQPDDVATIRMDSGPAAAAALKADGVDVVLLTPV